VDLNGITNLHSKKEAAYHEALVHPALFAHDKPRRVALIDGWDGTSLREVLKHRTVEKVTMVGMNESVATVAGTKLRGECNDCSDLVGSADSCFDDPRVEFVYSDAVSWFLEKSSHRNGSKEGDMYDIIILDSR
jgi:spermidine synthase